MSQVDGSANSSTVQAGKPENASGAPHFQRPLVSFTDHNKMSPSLVELRIDYHLNRIMKSYRLNNFANAIKALPLQSRICEKLIEILNSSENLIDRKLQKIKEGKLMLERLHTLSQSMATRGDMAVKDELMGAGELWSQFKYLANCIEQITWALNSNKEHLRYIARVHVLPAVYKRSEEEHIRLKELLVKTVENCTEVIAVCRTLRLAYEVQLRAIYGAVCLPQPPVATVPAAGNGNSGSAAVAAGTKDQPQKLLPSPPPQQQPMKQPLTQLMNDSNGVIGSFSSVSEGFSGSSDNASFSDSNSFGALSSSFSEDSLF